MELFAIMWSDIRKQKKIGNELVKCWTDVLVNFWMNERSSELLNDRDSEINK